LFRLFLIFFFLTVLPKGYGQNLRFNNYTSKTFRFGIKYPAGWRVHEEHAWNAPVAFIGDLEGKSDIYFENIQVILERVENMSIEMYLDYRIAELAKSYSDLRVIRMGRAQGFRYAVLNYTVLIPKKADIFCFLKDNTGITLHCISDPDTYEQWHDVYLQVAKSFYFR
jgi:hypothetical protein